jgi:hypothetical protein
MVAPRTSPVNPPIRSRARASTAAPATSAPSTTSAPCGPSPIAASATAGTNASATSHCGRLVSSGDASPSSRTYANTVGASATTVRDAHQMPATKAMSAG